MAGRAGRATALAGAALAGAALGLGASAAQADGDAGSGARIAAMWCANCHAADGAASAGDQAPSLASIARDPALDDAALMRAIADPHPRMPDPGLSRAQIADVIAWLATLR